MSQGMWVMLVGSGSGLGPGATELTRVWTTSSMGNQCDLVKKAKKSASEIDVTRQRMRPKHRQMILMYSTMAAADSQRGREIGRDGLEFR
ncbi:hypothetical protein ACFX13_004123 [Malus domestica]